MSDVVLPLRTTQAWRTSLPPQPDIEQVFSRYVDSVYRFLYSRVGNREDAEDLTSTVFLKATRQLDSSRAEASMAQWLFTVARTVLADHWREHYRSGLNLPLDETRAAEVPDEPLATKSAGNSSERAQHLLSALPDKYRAVLELRFLRGYSVKETAAELGLTTENVKVIQHRGLAKAAQIGTDADA